MTENKKFQLTPQENCASEGVICQVCSKPSYTPYQRTLLSPTSDRSEPALVGHIACLAIDESADYKVKNYDVEYNDYWKEWQLSHPVVGLAFESYPSLSEAILHAHKG